MHRFQNVQQESSKYLLSWLEMIKFYAPPCPPSD